MYVDMYVCKYNEDRRANTMSAFVYSKEQQKVLWLFFCVCMLICMCVCMCIFCDIGVSLAETFAFVYVY